jgi:hypothetical protein
MPELDKNLFSGNDKLSAEEWDMLSFSGGYQSVAEFLGRFGWDGRAAGCVNLHLSADNKKVESARFLLAGRWSDEPLRCQACKIWPDAGQHVILEIDLDNLSMFRFTEGEMSSDLIDGAAIKYRFIAAGQDGSERELDEEEYSAVGVGNFCLKAVASIAKSSGAKFGIWIQVTMLVMPGTQDAVVAISSLATNASWPGIKWSDGEMPMLPATGKCLGLV